MGLENTDDPVMRIVFGGGQGGADLGGMVGVVVYNGDASRP